MKILITGGAGYVGFNLARELDKLSQVKSITVYDNLYRNNLNFFIGESSSKSSADILTKTHFIKGDILDDYTLNKSLENIDVVIHMAAYVDNPYSYKDNYLYEQVNQFGTANLVSSMRNFKVKKLIYLSSGSVYGFQKESYEQTTPLPENGYGISKLEGEKYCRLLEDNLSLNIVRVGNIFGYNPMFRYHSVINRFMMDALIYNKIYIYGNGEQSRPFIHIDNVVNKLKEIVLENPISQIDNNNSQTSSNNNSQTSSNNNSQTSSYNNPLINLVDKNLTLNELRDMMLELIPDLEFTYVNANITSKSYEMFSNYYKPQRPFETLFKEAFTKFQQKFRLTH